MTGGNFEGGTDPAGDSLRVLLDKALRRAGMHAAVYGEVLDSGTGRETGSQSDGSPGVVTDYAFRLDGVFGKGSTVSYSSGDTITLRVPGGETPDASLTVPEAPRFSAGDRLVAFDQDQGIVARDAKTIVLLTAANVGTVTDSTVTFQKGAISLSEARDRLEKHPSDN